MKALYLALLLLITVFAISEASVAPLHPHDTPRRSSRRLKRAELPPPTLPDPTSSQQPSPSRPKGLYVNGTTCRHNKYAIVRNAVNGAALLTEAGLNALTPPILDLGGNPAPYFFRAQDFGLVARFLALAEQYFVGDQNDPAIAPVEVTCEDRQNWCPFQEEGGPGTAYVAVDDYSTIVICPGFFLFPPLQPPCPGFLSSDGVTGIGADNQAGTILHEFMHVISRGRIGDYAYGTRECNQLLSEKLQNPSMAGGPTKNADSYAWFAIWAYWLGLAVPGPVTPEEPYPLGSCLQFFLPGVAAGEWPSDPWWLRVWNALGRITAPPPPPPELSG